MTQTIKTLEELLAELPDNTVRAISPEDVRDVVVSLLGALEITDPTGFDDNVDTAGNGSFDAGQTWMNTLAKSAWICFDGSPLIADWAEIQLVRNLPPAVPQIFTARLASQPTPATALSATGIPVAYGSNSYEVELGNPADIQFIGLGDLVEFASGRTPATIIKYITSPYIGFITSNNSTGASSTDTATVTPYANDWFETIGNAVNSALNPKPGGRSGTITTAPAIQMGYQASRGTTDSDVWMRFRGMSSGLPVFDYEAMGIPFSAVYNYGAPSQTVPTVFNFYGSSSFPTTTVYNAGSYALVNTWISFGYVAGLTYPPCSMYVDASCNLYMNDSSGAPQRIVTGQSCGNVSATSTSGYVTVIDVTCPTGMIGAWNLAVLSGFKIRYQVTTDDVFAGVKTGTGTLTTAGPLGGVSLTTSMGSFAIGCQPPLKHFKLEIQEFNPGDAGVYRCWWNIMPC